MANIILWFILWITIIVGVVLWLNQLMQSWFYDQIVQWMNIFVDLFWTELTVIFVALFALAWATLIIRFAMSFFWTDPGRPANR